jgi:hypothetical protein
MNQYREQSVSDYYKSVMKKTAFLIIALIMAGFIAAPAQNNISLHKKQERKNTNFEYPEFETPKFPAIKQTKSGQDRWEPDTVYCFAYVGENVEWTSRFIFEYKKLFQGLLTVGVRQDQINDSWVNGMQLTCTYDSNYNVLTENVKKWENDSWINFELYASTYDSNNNFLSKIKQNWINDIWVNSLSYTCAYDSNNNLLTEIHQNWINNSWENYNLTTRTYDSNNNVLSFTRQFIEDNLWKNVFNQYIYTYDLNNNLLTKLSQYLSNGMWKSTYLSTYTYDLNNKMQTHLYQTWQTLADSWEDTLFETYVFDSNDNLLTLLTTYNFDGHSVLLTCTYDSNNNLLTELHQYWENDSWVNGKLIRMIYDENGNGISTESLQWINESWQPTNNFIMSFSIIWLYYNNMQNALGMRYCDKMIASYVKISGDTGIEEIKTALPIQIHSAGKTIHINNQTGKNAVITVYRIDGVKVAEQTMASQTMTLEMPAGGFYLVSVKAGDEKPVTAKVIIR